MARPGESVNGRRDYERQSIRPIDANDETGRSCFSFLREERKDGVATRTDRRKRAPISPTMEPVHRHVAQVI